MVHLDNCFLKRNWLPDQNAEQGLPEPRSVCPGPYGRADVLR